MCSRETTHGIIPAVAVPLPRDHIVRCLQLTEWGGDLQRAETERPTPGPTEVLVEVEATSVGRTVYNNITGYMADSSDPLPLIPGHEIVGRIVERGEAVEGHENGGLVAAYYYLNCGRCDYCQRSLEPLCENTSGRLGVDRDGGYAEYVSLPEANVIGLPEMDPVDATVIPDAVATPVHVAADRAAIEPGDDVMVIGAGGGVGIHLVQVARHHGASVTAVDLDAGKLDRCRAVGANYTVDTSSTSLGEHADAEGIRYDAIVDFTGVMDLVSEAVELVGPRGRLVNLSAFEGRSFELQPRTQVLGEIEVVGSRYCAKYELRRAAELVANGVVEPVVSEVVDLDGVQGLLEAIADDRVIGRGAVVP